MNQTYQATITNGALVLPAEMMKQGNFREGDVMDITIHSQDRFGAIRQVAHRGLFKTGATVTADQLKTYLAKLGFAATPSNPDVWQKNVARKTAEGAALGTLYQISVSLTDLLAHPDHLAAFVRHHH